MEGLGVWLLLFLFILSMPLFDGEPLNGSVVARFHGSAKFFVFGVHCLVEKVGHDRGYSVQCVMTRQPFRRETLHCPDSWSEPLRNLVFDRSLERGMRLDAWEFDASRPVVPLNKPDSFLLVEFKPFFRIRRDLWIVVLHDGSLRRLTFDMSGSQRRG